MNRLVIFGLSLFALSVATTVATAQSALRFAESQHDFGTINEDGGIVSHTFRFTNIADVPVVVIDVASSCGCTKAEFSRKPVQAGADGEIIVRFDPMDYPAGAFSRKVTVSTSQGRESLTVTGRVKPRKKSIAERYPLAIGNGIRLESNAHAFGYVEHGSAQRSAIGMINDSDKAARIDITLATTDSRLDIRHPHTLAPHEEGAIDFGYILPEGCSVYGTMRDLAAISIDGKASDYELIISGMAIDSRNREGDNGEPAAQLSENFIKFGMLKSTDAAQRRTIVLYNAGGAPLHLRHVETERGVVAVIMPDRRTVAAGGKTILTVVLHPSKCPFGAVADRIKIITDDADRPVLSVKVTALIENS
ncbi:MAG: DUF1573 domain-containing protein [Alistipes sp.]